MITEATLILRIFIAVILGGIVGYEREKLHRPAGLRTHILVCVGAATVILLTVQDPLGQSYDVGRIIAGVVTGIGFLGAGTIMASRNNHIHGLTTAASIWVVAGIGIAVGLGSYLLALTVSLITFILLEIKPLTDNIG